MPTTRARLRAILVPSLVGAMAAALMLPPAAASASPNATHAGVVVGDPVNWTPNVFDGDVRAITEVGDWIVAGGEFTTVREPGGSDLERVNIFAFNRTTGQISRAFVPDISGPVEAVEAAPDGGVFVGGRFGTVNGVSRRGLVKLDMNGQIDPTFTATARWAVNDLALAGNVLYLGGSFYQVNGVGVDAFAAVDATTGVLDTEVDLGFADPISTTQTTGSLSVDRLDVSADGSRVFVMGNFRTIAGQTRYRVALIDTSVRPAQLSAWRTDGYQEQCRALKWPQYIRDLDMSPDGTFVVVVSTGAYRAPPSLCDTAARFDLTDETPGQTPAWVDYSGGDSLHGVAVTGAAVYVGGHMRWMNNSHRGDAVGPGAVDRVGFAALDVRNGMPLTMRADRNPRGVGARELVATSAGLWVGSDTAYIADEFRSRIALLPAGGPAVPRPGTGPLPGTVQRIVNGVASDRTFDGSSAGSPSAVSTSGISWSAVRAATLAGGTLYTARTDGTLHAGSYDGATYTGDRTLDLHGLHSTELPLASLTSLAFDEVRSRMYYTVEGDDELYYRHFTPESEILGSEKLTATPGSIDFTATRGAFVANGMVYQARTDGSLWTWQLGDHGRVVAGSAQLAHAGGGSNSWNGVGLYTLGGTTATNQAPVAALDVSCTDDVCRLDASGSHDPDGHLVEWNFSVDGEPIPSTGSIAEWVADRSGTFTFEVEVVDDAGATDTDSATGSATALTSATLRGVSGWSGWSSSPSVGVPVGAAAGDVVLVAASAAQSGLLGTPQGLSGPVTEVGSLVDGPMEQRLWWAVLGPDDVGGSVSVPMSSGQQVALQVLAYAGVDTSAPVEAWAAAGQPGNSASHVSPTVDTAAESLVVSWWADKTSGSTSWALPGDQLERSLVSGTGGGHMTSVVADAGAVSSAGTHGGLTATSQVTSYTAGAWTIALRSQDLPSASIAVDCDGLACTFDGSGSSAQVGSVASWAWDLGDGSTPSGATVQHTYAAPGSYEVSLVVTDTEGGQEVATTTVDVVESLSAATFRGASEWAGWSSSPSVGVPSEAVSGDVVLVAASVAQSGLLGTPQGLSGPVTEVGSLVDGPMEQRVWWAVLGPDDVGGSVSVPMSSGTQVALQVLAYGGVDDSAPVEAWAAAGQPGNSASHVSPTVDTAAESLVVSWWADKTTGSESWSLPGDQLERSLVAGSGGGHMTSVVADPGAVSSAGTHGGLTATSQVTSYTAGAWTIALRSQQP